MFAAARFKFGSTAVTVTKIEVQNHFDSLRRTARMLTANHADADDIAQEAVVRAITYAKDGRHVQNWRGYLTRVVRNVAADHYAKRAMQGIPVELDDAHSDLSVLPNQFHHHRVHELETALTNLPAPQTEIIRLIAIDGLSYSDAATRLGVPVGTVMSRLYRARENLRRRLEDGWPLGDARSTKKAPAPAPAIA